MRFSVMLGEGGADVKYLVLITTLKDYYFVAPQNVPEYVRINTKFETTRNSEIRVYNTFQKAYEAAIQKAYELAVELDYAIIYNNGIKPSLTEREFWEKVKTAS